MLLRDISLYLNVDEHDRTYRSEFAFRSRYLCNFIRRRIVPLKFHANGFRSVAVQGCHRPEDLCPILGEDVAVATVAFDQSRYESLGPHEHHEFFIAMLVGGLEKCAVFHDIPLAAMKEAIEDFRRGGYRNEWTHLKKMLRPARVQASLLCRMDGERFVLILKVERKGALLFEEPILETKPDEIIFAHRFKDLVVEGDALVVRNKFGKPTFSLPLSSLR